MQTVIPLGIRELTATGPGLECMQTIIPSGIRELTATGPGLECMQTVAAGMWSIQTLTQQRGTSLKMVSSFFLLKVSFLFVFCLYRQWEKLYFP